MKALREAVARKVSCFVTHRVFPNESWRKFAAVSIENGGMLDIFYICDSIPSSAQALSHWEDRSKYRTIVGIFNGGKKTQRHDDRSREMGHLSTRAFVQVRDLVLQRRLCTCDEQEVCSVGVASYNCEYVPEIFTL